MKKLITIILLGLFGFSSNAQSYADYRTDRHYYDEDFDWHWDIRVRISDGINAGYLNNRESNRLYKKLERIEEKEYAFMADGHFNNWEQEVIWQDVKWLNRKVGFDLYDYDRNYYGFSGIYVSYNSYPFWYNRYYSFGWDFYRYDRIGYGSVRYGYAPRFYYPQNNVYVYHNYKYVYGNKQYHKGYSSGKHSKPNYGNSKSTEVVRRDLRSPSTRYSKSSGSSSNTYQNGRKSSSASTVNKNKVYASSKNAKNSYSRSEVSRNNSSKKFDNKSTRRPSVEKITPNRSSRKKSESVTSSRRTSSSADKSRTRVVSERSRRN